MRKETIAKLKSAVWFLVKLNVLAIPLYLITYFSLSFPPLQDAWALALDQSLRSFGYETAVQGSTVAVKSGLTIHQINFSWDSTGWKSLYALTALVFASGVGTLRGKLRFLAFGLPLVAFVNFLRVGTTVLFSLASDFGYFEFVHNVLWGGLMVIFVLAVWYFLFLKEKVNRA